MDNTRWENTTAVKDSSRMMSSWTVIILVTLTHVCHTFKTHPYTVTKSGAVRGSRVKVIESEVHAFLGIPYGEPPTGNLRFSKPIPVAPWDGIFDATGTATPCFQQSIFSGDWVPQNDTVSEDCLYLNVWVPRTRGNKNNNEPLKAVMVWIHGGAFFIGASSLDIYNGETLAAVGDVIVASMNYRLGIFGFLNAETEDAPGNMGMYDQLLALRWIKENIEAFGGDPSRITIFGESAGSMSVGLHLLSPLSHGLFSRAIMQSGGPHHPEWGGESSCTGPVRGEKVAQAVGCSHGALTMTKQPHDVIECLKSKDPIVLAKAGNVVFEDLKHFFPRYGDDFMPFSPITAIRDGIFNRTQLLAGVTSAEGIAFLGLKIPALYLGTDIPTLTMDYVKSILQDVSKTFSKTTVSEIQKEYFEGIDESDQKALLRNLAAVIGDSEILCPTMLQAESFAKEGSPVFFYYLDHHPSNSVLKPWMGMSHFEEVQFVFGLPLRNPSSYTKEEEEFSRSIIDIWTTFAKTGKPQYPEDKLWPEYHPDRDYVELKANHYKILRGPHLGHCDFWRNYYQ